MTDFHASDRDVNRVIQAWLDEDRHEDASRLAGAVLDQVEALPQRRATWWRVRRTPTMNRFLSVGAAAAVIVLVLLAGSRLFGSPANIGGPGVEPTATQEATQTPEPSAAEPSVDPEGLLPEGPHLLTDGRLPITVTIPAPDWYGEPGGAILAKNDSAGTGSAAMIVFFSDLYVYGDPCQWSTTRPDTPATTVDEVMTALSAQASRDASEPVDVTLDGYAGKAITLHVPDDADFSACDRATFGSWGLPGADQTPFRYHQDPGQIDEVWVLDVDGELAIIDWAYYEGTPQAVVDELREIVESITFETP